jgi:undecaprenyl-diphosphatase
MRSSMSNLHLFELLNASPGLEGMSLLGPILLARWLVIVPPLVMVVAWIRGSPDTRIELLQMTMAVVIALGAGHAVCHFWPQSRPFVLHLGTQYLSPTSDPCLPSDHATVFWTLATAAFYSHRFAVWTFPLLASGLLVGWSRVYLGVLFPFDVLAALPVALAGATAVQLLRRPMRPLMLRIASLYDCVDHLVRGMFRKAGQ